MDTQFRRDIAAIMAERPLADGDCLELSTLIEAIGRCREANERARLEDTVAGDRQQRPLHRAKQCPHDSRPLPEWPRWARSVSRLASRAGSGS